MTIITIYTGRCRSFRASPGDELKVVLQEKFDEYEELSYARTTEKTFHREVPVGVGVGTQDWSVSCVSNLPIEQKLTRLEEKFDAELQDVRDDLRDVKNELRGLQQDSVLWATLYLRNVASEALLFAYGDQPNPQGPTHRFQNLANNSDPKLTLYASSLAFSPDPVALGPILDGIINRRNSTVHFRDAQGLREGVHNVEGLLARHPDLRKRCQYEVMVIDSFDDLTAAFSV